MLTACSAVSGLICSPVLVDTQSAERARLFAVFNAKVQATGRMTPTSALQVNSKAFKARIKDGEELLRLWHGGELAKAADKVVDAEKALLIK